MDSPEDNTAVIRMKKEFNSFIGRSNIKNRLSFEQSSLLNDTDVSVASHASGVTMKSLIGMYTNTEEPTLSDNSLSDNPVNMICFPCTKPFHMLSIQF